MRYSVAWAPEAESDLEAIVAAAALRSVILEAAQKIDGRLISDPYVFGESRFDRTRMGFVLPLGVEYEVFDDLRHVIVYGVWRVGRRSRS